MTFKWRLRVLLGLFGYLFVFYFVASIVLVTLLIGALR